MNGRTPRMPLLGLIALSLATLGGMAVASANAGRADCPGKIICPITGELVCWDRCPSVDSSRSDCPGRIECPVTGDLVCRDRCPARGTVADGTQTASRPSCCQAREG